MKPFEMLVMIKKGLGDEGLAACRERLEGWLAETGAMAQRIRVDEEILRHMLIGRHPAALKTIKRPSEERERERARERNNGKRR